MCLSSAAAGRDALEVRALSLSREWTPEERCVLAVAGGYQRGVIVDAEVSTGMFCVAIDGTDRKLMGSASEIVVDTCVSNSKWLKRAHGCILNTPVAIPIDNR